MGKINDVVADALERLFAFIGNTVQFVFGLFGVMLLAALPAGADVLDDITTYKNSPVDWAHVAKVLYPAEAAAVGAYLVHKRQVNKALATPAPQQNGGDNAQ